MRRVPNLTFINKNGPAGACSPWSLIDEIESELAAHLLRPVNWPIGSGDRFSRCDRSRSAT